MKNKDLLLEFEKVTDELLAIVIHDGIDEIIGQIERGLSKREEIIAKISPEEDNENAEIKTRIIQKDDQLNTKLSEIKLIISGNISNIVKEKSLSSLKKKAHRGYLSRGHQNDGFFIDKKK